MRVIKVKNYREIPKDYTGLAEFNDGSKVWYLNCQYHREDGPAVELWVGSKFWYLNGERHREDGPACEYISGEKEWWRNGQLHREDGPACEGHDGSKEWFLNGKLFFELPPKSQPFVLIEEFVDGEGKEQIKVLTQQGIEIWKDVPGLKKLADNWEGVNSESNKS